MDHMIHERRKHPRIEKNIPVKISGEEFDIVTETRNLSCAGAYCQVNRYLEPMSKLKIHLLLPFRKAKKVVTKKVTCQGVVVRIEHQSGVESFNVAIYFNEIRARDAKTIAEYVNSGSAQKKAE